MCEKQCRDENGFKCHTMSESHLRQMRLYAENPTQVRQSSIASRSLPHLIFRLAILRGVEACSPSARVANPLIH